MMLPSMTSLALELGRAVHMILINATSRLEMVTISEMQNQQINYYHKHTCTNTGILSVIIVQPIITGRISCQK